MGGAGNSATMRGHPQPPTGMPSPVPSRAESTNSPVQPAGGMTGRPAAPARGSRLGLALLVLALLVSAAAGAQPVTKVVVPFPAGAAYDRIARLLAPYLAEGLGRTVVVENHPGAEGAIGAEYAARAQPDGNTLLFSNTSLAAGRANSERRFDPQRDLAPVAQVTRLELYLVANAALEATAAADLVDLARKRPKGLNCAGATGPLTLGCILLRAQVAGMETIPYQGFAPAIKALLAGEVDVMFVGQNQLPALLASKHVRILAVANARPAAPPHERVPVLKDTYPGIVIDDFGGFFVPAATPDATVQHLNREIVRILGLPAVQVAFKQAGYLAATGTPGDLARLLERAVEAYRAATTAAEAP